MEMFPGAYKAGYQILHFKLKNILKKKKVFKRFM